MARWSKAWAVTLLFTSSCASAYAAPLTGSSSASALAEQLRRDGALQAAARPAPTPTASQYVVQPGDTLWRISQRFAMSVTELRARNNLDGNNAIKVGQQLTVTTETRSPTTESRSPITDDRSPTTETRRLTTDDRMPPTDRRPSTTEIRSSRRYGLVWPVEGVLTSRYGARNGKGHDGIDIGAAPGTGVKAAAAGDVIFADTHGSYGNLVLVRHAGGLVTVYAHNSKNLVNKGQRVKQGQAIATVGATGHATGPHLHFEVRRGVEAVNPLSLLPP